MPPKSVTLTTARREPSAPSYVLLAIVSLGFTASLPDIEQQSEADGYSRWWDRRPFGGFGLGLGSSRGK
jgi:hypothetical protein